MNPLVRFIHLYLAVYFLLIAGAVFALWQAQVLQRMPGEWVGLSYSSRSRLAFCSPCSPRGPRRHRPSATNPLTSDFSCGFGSLAPDWMRAGSWHAIWFTLTATCAVSTLLSSLSASPAWPARKAEPFASAKLDFKGVQAVSEARLRAALATRVSSRLPWGKKAFFDRSRFDADLKRIEAFYADRGYPDARVRSFDVHLNDKQDSVDLTLTIDEGPPGARRCGELQRVRGRRIRIVSSHCRKQMPLKIGSPRDRQHVGTTHELAVNELREHGYPYAKVSTSGRRWR